MVILMGMVVFNGGICSGVVVNGGTYGYDCKWWYQYVVNGGGSQCWYLWSWWLSMVIPIVVVVVVRGGSGDGQRWYLWLRWLSMVVLMVMRGVNGCTDIGDDYQWCYYNDSAFLAQLFFLKVH